MKDSKGHLKNLESSLHQLNINFSNKRKEIEIDKTIYKLTEYFGMTRYEIIHYYTRFKALCYLTQRSEDKAYVDISQGINFEVFTLGIPEMALEQEDFVYTLFKLANIDDRSKYMTWDNFLIAIKALDNISLGKRIDEIFRVSTFYSLTF